MKRKIIALGKRTAVTTLPSAWLREKELKAGDFLELEEHGNWISLSLTENRKESLKEENIQELEEMTNRYMGALYKAGYDKIILKVKKKQIPIIQATLERTCIGLEIIKTTDTEVHIHRIAHLEDIDVENLIKRMFFTLQSTAQDFLLALYSNKKEDFLSVIKKDDQTNRLADTVRRYLNKEQKDPLNYALAEQLENIGDWYKNKAKEKKHLLSQEKLKKINEMIELLYDLYFAFSLEKLEHFGKHAKEIKKSIHGEESLESLFTMLFDVHGIILTKRV
ncbi:MAG: hypothetical protein Q8R18_04490 [bacterium]|nr:hypothetical protein [bacterium]